MAKRKIDLSGLEKIITRVRWRFESQQQAIAMHGEDVEEMIEEAIRREEIKNPGTIERILSRTKDED